MAVDQSALIASDAQVPSSATVWGLAQIRERARLGDCVIVGRGAYIGADVSVGAKTKIQNYALVYEPAEIAEGVFIGPGAILTNDRFPRAVNPDGSRKEGTDWVPVGVTVRQGASIGAGAICVAPVRIGEWAMVAAGAVVTADVAPFALVMGAPARQVGWVSRAGHRLVSAGPRAWICPVTSEAYVERADGSIELSE